MVMKVRFPKISANVVEATITAWCKQEGEAVAKDEMLAEITTDKGAVEFTSPGTGVLRRILAPVNSTLPVGYVMALIAEAHEELPDVTAANEALLSRHRASLAATAPGASLQAPSGMVVEKRQRSMVRATPAARRLAREHQVDLEAVQKKAGGAVVGEDDVKAYLAER